jgi:hypothetical protein
MIGVESPSKVTDKGLKHLLQFTGLKQVELRFLKVSEDGVRELQKLPPLDGVIFGAIPVTDKTILPFISHGKCRMISLLYTHATVGCLPAILKNTGLEELGLRGIPCTDEDIQCLTALRKLKSLGVGSSALTNAGVRHLEALPDLFLLEFQNCAKIDDGVFEHIGNLKKLTDLGLQSVNITDAGLAKLKTLPKLERLFLHDVKVSAEGVAKLRRELPKLKVEWDGDLKEKGK